MPTPQMNQDAARSAAPATARPGASWASKLIGVQGPLIGLVALCVVFSVATSAFLSFRNLLNVLDQVTVLGILSVGMTAVIILGGIDLSVGSVLAFSMMIMGWLSHDMNLPLAIAAVLALLIGAFAVG
jgi:ribose transport system permease protein